MILDQIDVPIVLAPLAGGPTTPQLAAAVASAGGLGFLAAGYLTAAALAEQIRQARELTTRPLGVNVFVPGGEAADHGPVADYAAMLAAEAQQAGVELGLPRFDDDDWDGKLALLTADPLPVTSFTFGCPEAAIIQALQAEAGEVWVTVTTPAEAVMAADAGADVLVVQGSEAGGHRGSFIDDPADDASGSSACSRCSSWCAAARASHSSRPGASAPAPPSPRCWRAELAAQIGTAFLLPGGGHVKVQRAAVASAAPTAMTRAFTGRNARGIRNRFMDGYNAPAAYPEVHYLTAPLRAAGRRSGDPGLVNRNGRARPTSSAASSRPPTWLLSWPRMRARAWLLLLPARSADRRPRTAVPGLPGLTASQNLTSCGATPTILRGNVAVPSSSSDAGTRPSEELFSVSGKVAVVTGGSRGIGAMIAGGLVRAGCRVYITARKAEACDAKAAELSALGECISVPLDLAARGSADELVRVISEREDRLHILVNNAVASWGAPLEEYPLEAFDKVLNINVKALFELTVRSLPLLRAAVVPGDPARVINIGSIDGLGVEAAGELRLQRQQGGSAHAHATPGQPAGAGVDHSQRHRAGPVRQQDDGVRA